ncbi:hypothetical protein C8R46DRAFT_1107697 [Mycena filopes]|nr:hypothetical protein C8R46DRAFT_1107697 [Mycena filopes]
MYHNYPVLASRILSSRALVALLSFAPGCVCSLASCYRFPLPVLRKRFRAPVANQFCLSVSFAHSPTPHRKSAVNVSGPWILIPFQLDIQVIPLPRTRLGAQEGVSVQPPGQRRLQLRVL